MAGREGGECKRIQNRFLPSDDLKQLRLQRPLAEDQGIQKELSFEIVISLTNGRYYKGYSMALGVKLPISLH